MLTIKSAHTKQKGFTLIELMLVLALVVVLTMAGLATYQIQLRNFKVDKTALQMQQWLQAGLAFYADCGKWPANQARDPVLFMVGDEPIPAESCDTALYQNKTRAYMPAGSDYGPWYIADAKSNNRYVLDLSDKENFKTSPMKDSPMFRVETPIGSVNDTSVETAAKMIAGRLPNGEILPPRNNLLWVRASIPQAPYNTGGGGGGTNGFIVDMEMVSSTQTAKHIKKPDPAVCGPNLIPVLVGAISGLDAGRANEPNAGQKYAVMRSYLTNTMDSKTGFIALDNLKVDLNNKIQPTIQIERNLTVGRDDPSLKQDGRNQFLLISACLPNPDKNAKNKVAEGSPGVRY